ncbi:MAG: N-6 DNA methylase [candidate division WOR-3 bacterium]
MLVKDLLGTQPGFIEEYLAGIEKYLRVKQRDGILRGEADNLFGNVIIEFESDITKKRPEAESQLRRYVAIAWSQEKPESRRPYLCIATDGIRFLTYTPAIADSNQQEIVPEDVRLNLLGEVDWTRLNSDEIYYWLDRHFLRQEDLNPTTEFIVRDFGIKSHAYQTATTALLNLWQKIKSQSESAVIYETWNKYLRIVYGSTVADDELFIRHTYLATLAKLLAWMRLTQSTSLPDDAQIIEMLEGLLFKKHGIENFIEEDFFSWVARPNAQKVGVGVVRRLFSLLQNYNLRELSEDVLKSLYQELVDPETRHDLGEFYTPDWLAHRMVNYLLNKNPAGSVLDPACGSGTFLYLTIKEKRRRLGNTQKTLYHILNSVCGVDVHPLAVIIAKTNFILALGDLLQKRKGHIVIPVYLANTLRLPERMMGSPLFILPLEGQEFPIPEELLQDTSLYDQSVELAKEFARQNKGKNISEEAFHNFLLAQNFPYAHNETLVNSIFKLVETLKVFIDKDRDTIWAFVLKNIYKPHFLLNKFDFVIGNPPWIAFRALEPNHQKYLKTRITNIYKLTTGAPENIPNLEVGTFFFIRASDLYLKLGGTIAFVLPKSIFSADQHDGLRRRTFELTGSGEKLYWQEVWDCENVTPLFNVPACVLIAEKREVIKPPPSSPSPFAGEILEGELSRKNASLQEAEYELKVTKTRFYLHIRGKRSFWAVDKAVELKGQSYYIKKFLRGAELDPRPFWFVEVKPSPLGFNPDLPPLETAERAKKEAKDAYKGLVLKGTVESRFLYASLLSTDLLPFGHLDYRLVVLPIEPADDHYKLIDAGEARKRGFLHLAQWLEKVEKEWEKRRSVKARSFTVLQWLDYRKNLTNQNPKARYRVIYNTSGTILTAAVVENENISFKFGNQEVRAQGFIADTVTYCYETNDKQSAYSLAAILNSPYLDHLIKPMQSRGLWGPRHLHKKPLEFPIPKFDERNPIHLRLSELGEKCTEKVRQWLDQGGAKGIKDIGRLRALVRQLLAPELAEIDQLVQKLLG